MPFAFAESSGGILYLANGLDAPRRWDGLAAQTELVGVLAPPSAPTTSTGAGADGANAIIGVYYTAYRYVNKNGLVSNLSPLSAATSVVGAAGVITAVTAGTPIRVTLQVTSGTYQNKANTRIFIQGCSLTLANGTWAVSFVSQVGATVVLDLTNSSAPPTRATLPAGGIWRQGVDRFIYSNFPTTINGQPIADFGITRMQALRTTAGQADVLYVDLDTTDVSTTTHYSLKSDDDLSTQEAVPILDANGDLFANRHGIPPNWKPFIAPYLDRMYLAGEVEYAQGTVRTRQGKSFVQGLGVAWPATLAGRYLYVNGHNQSYLISAVYTPSQTTASAIPNDPATGLDINIDLFTGQRCYALLLSQSYQGADRNYANYGIRPDPDERRLLYHSEAGLPESWPAVNALSLQEDGDEITGLMIKSSFLYLLERKHIYRFTTQGDPARDGFVYLAGLRGCVNNRAWVVVEDVAYLMDEEGCHAFTGGASSEPISQPIQAIFRRDTTEKYRINWAAKEFFHAAHDPQSEVVRWFVALGGHYLPRHALAYDYRHRRWWIEEYPIPIGANCLGELDIRSQLLLGSSARRILAPGIGTLDGPDPGGGTVRGTVTSAGARTLTDTSALFGAYASITGATNASPIVLTVASNPYKVGQRVTVSGVLGNTAANGHWTVSAITSTTVTLQGTTGNGAYTSGGTVTGPFEGVLGSSIRITSGRGKGQWRIVQSVIGQTIRVQIPWRIRPDTTSTYQLGGVKWSYRTRWLRFAADESDSPRRIEVLFEPLEFAATLDARRYRDRQPDALEWDRTLTSAQGDGLASTQGQTDLEGDLTTVTGSLQKRFDASKETYTDGLEWTAWELGGVSNRELIQLVQITLDGVEPVGGR